VLFDPSGMPGLGVTAVLWEVALPEQPTATACWHIRERDLERLISDANIALACLREAKDRKRQEKSA